ncbi:nuclear transport factor 2 family protein [Nocardiopsis terrae]
MDKKAVVELVGKYISIWNEPDPRARKAAIDDVFTGQAVYVDPTITADGVAAIDRYIADAQRDFTGMLFTHGAVLTHHDAVHFSWRVGPADGAPAVSGSDVAWLEGGQIKQLYGFFDGY